MRTYAGRIFIQRLLSFEDTRSVARVRELAKAAVQPASGSTAKEQFQFMAQPKDTGRQFRYQMLKEIYEQPDAIRRTIEQHLDPVTRAVRLDRSSLTASQLRAINKVTIVASGSSRHAGLCGKHMIEELAGIPVEVEHASEYGYRRTLPANGTLVIAITQSGETADTTTAQRVAKENGFHTLSISNVVDSTIAREADANLFTCAGREIAIPATKSFTTQLAALYILALFLGAEKDVLSADEVKRHIAQLAGLPDTLESLLERFDEQAGHIARDFSHDTVFLYLGRGIHYPIALEGGLKLKEISYVHVEGYPTGELRHGPTALIDENLPMVVLLARDDTDPDSMLRYEKSLSVLHDIRKYSQRQILIVSEGDREIQQLGTPCFTLPAQPELLLPIIEVVPLQLFAYHVAVLNGLNVDRPRNLVKSVMVE